MKKRAVFIVNVIFTLLTVETAILVSVFGYNDYNSNVADDIFGKTSVFFYVYIFLVLICMLLICWRSVLYFARSTKTIVQTILHVAFILFSLFAVLGVSESIYPFVSKIGMDFLNKYFKKHLANLLFVLPVCCVFTVGMESFWKLTKKRNQTFETPTPPQKNLFKTILKIFSIVYISSWLSYFTYLVVENVVMKGMFDLFGLKKTRMDNDKIILSIVGVSCAFVLLCAVLTLLSDKKSGNRLKKATFIVSFITNLSFGFILIWRTLESFLFVLIFELLFIFSFIVSLILLITTTIRNQNQRGLTVDGSKPLKK